MTLPGVGSENDGAGGETEESSRAIEPPGPKSATKSLTPCWTPAANWLSTSSGLTSGNNPNGTKTLASGWVADVKPCAGSPYPRFTITFRTGWIRSATGLPISGIIRSGSNSGRFSVGMKKYFCVGDVDGSAIASVTSCWVRQKV